MLRRAALFVVSALPILLVARSAAADDCPPGSSPKTEDGFSWCQPSVCANDSQCDPGQVCREYSLCMQVGQLGDAGSKVDGGGRLVVTQVCAPEKRCPQLQTCSTLGRCMASATADKLGILSTAPAPSGKAPGDGTTPPPKSCGCRAAGAPAGGGFALAGLGLVAIALRARGRRRAR